MTNQMTTEKQSIENIEIPDTALTTCPARRFGLVGIKGACLKCNLFLGLSDVADGKDEPFQQRYRVKCGMPQAREITMFDNGA